MGTEIKSIDAVKIIDSILKTTEKNIIVAIDGRCASGKTTYARFLKEQFQCNVFHMDDFFLKPEQRTEERLAEPGGNVDRVRFYDEVIKGILSGKDFTYRPFECKSMSLGEEVSVKPSKLNIIEGSYSCHPYLRDNYDIKFFMTIAPDIQKERIYIRNKDKADMFFNKWIPLEEKYFSAFDISSECDYIIIT
ncbi:MAG: uridine kinase [Clostridia bacterium]|nr:uridine kinase [Clostridia bacterium]